MKRLLTMAIALFALGSSTLAAGDGNIVNITISSNHGQIKTSATSFSFFQEGFVYP